MEEDKRKQITKIIVLSIILLLLPLVPLYYLFQGKLLWTGISLIFGGVLISLFRLPAAAVPILCGIIIILGFYKETVLLRIVALISIVVLLHDLTSLIRLVVSKKYSIFFNKSEAKNFPARMRESELTYKLWNKFKRKELTLDVCPMKADRKMTILFLVGCLIGVVVGGGLIVFITLLLSKIRF